jgi:hypothetical protein
MAKNRFRTEYMEKELVHEKCEGCTKVMKDSTCSAYPKPAIWWRRGKCPLADHLEVKTKTKDRVRVGQQKSRKK